MAKDIIDNSNLQQGNGNGTTPVSGQQQQGATQTTGQSQAPATQTTDANQASGGEGNAGVSQQNSDAAAAQGTGQSVVGNGTTVPTGDGTTQTGNGTTQQVVADGSTQPVAGDGTTTPPAAATPTYLADWGNITFMDAVKSGNKSIADYMRDYNKWATANNQDPLDIYTMMQAINGNDIGESYAENEKAQRRLKRQQTWEQIGNVLAHLGNFVGTLAGAPSATYETGPQLTARQQAVRDAVEKQRGDPKNILAQIWKDRADQRARELKNANVALQGARKANVEGQTVNQKAQSDATVALRGAQQHQAETAAQENQARADYMTGQNDRAEELQPLKKANIRSSTNANNARANASNASAAHSRAETYATNQRAYGARYQANRYRIWAKNRRLHPNESREFMKANNIHSFDRKNWTKDLIDQYNGYIADKFSGGGRKGTNASSLLD